LSSPRRSRAAEKRGRNQNPDESSAARALAEQAKDDSDIPLISPVFSASRRLRGNILDGDLEVYKVQ
jgi:hypothetical protein